MEPKTLFKKLQTKGGEVKPNHALNLVFRSGIWIFFLLRCQLAVALADAQNPETLSASPPNHWKRADSSSDGQSYACATDAGRIFFGDTQCGIILRTFYICEPVAVALSSDGRLLAAAGKGAGCPSKIKVWDTRNGSLLFTVETEIVGRSLLKFSEDSRLLASSTLRALEVWNLSKDERHSSHSFLKNVSHLTFTGDNGRILVAVCDDGTSHALSLP